MTIETEMSLNADGNTVVTACLWQQLADCSMRVMLLRETNGLPELTDGMTTLTVPLEYTSAETVLRVAFSTARMRTNRMPEKYCGVHTAGHTANCISQKSNTSSMAPSVAYRRRNCRRWLMRSRMAAHGILLVDSDTYKVNDRSFRLPDSRGPWCGFNSSV